MVFNVLIVFILLNSSFIYNAEPKSQLSLQEMALISCAKINVVPKIEFLDTQVGDLVLQTEKEMNKYGLSVAKDSEVGFLAKKSPFFSKYMQKMCNNGFILHKALTERCKLLYTIASVNKVVLQHLKDYLTTGKQSLDDLFIKIYVFVRADIFVNTDIRLLKTDAVRYVRSEIMRYYMLLAHTAFIKDTVFLNAMFLYEAILLPQKSLVDSSKNKIVEAIHVFLNKLNSKENKQALLLTIPLDDFPEQSLLHFLCKQKNINMVCEAKINSEENNKEEICIRAVYFSFFEK